MDPRAQRNSPAKAMRSRDCEEQLLPWTAPWSQGPALPAGLVSMRRGGRHPLSSLWPLGPPWAPSPSSHTSSFRTCQRPHPLFFKVHLGCFPCGQPPHTHSVSEKYRECRSCWRQPTLSLTGQGPWALEGTWLQLGGPSPAFRLLLDQGQPHSAWAGGPAPWGPVFSSSRPGWVSMSSRTAPPRSYVLPVKNHKPRLAGPGGGRRG